MPKMSLAEALTEGLQVTGIGLIIVFSVLIILMLVMMAMKVVFYKEEPQSKSEVKEAEKKTAPVPVEKKTDDSELIAVLTAAITASMDVPVSSLSIKSYKKVSNWNRAGIRDIIDSRF